MIRNKLALSVALVCGFLSASAIAAQPINATSGKNFIIEAEDFDEQNWNGLGEGYWDKNTDQGVNVGGASGNKYMISGPYAVGGSDYFSSPQDVANSAGGAIKVPNMTYKVYSPGGGTYDLWVRWYEGADATSQDSFYVTVNNTVVPTSVEVNAGSVHLLSSGWKWRKAAISVTLDPGVNELFVWKREGGTIIDRIVLSDGSFTNPGAGKGPAKSPRQVPPPVTCASGPSVSGATKVVIEAETRTHGSDNGPGSIVETWSGGTGAKIGGAGNIVGSQMAGTFAVPSVAAPWNCYSFDVTAPTEGTYTVWARTKALSNAAQGGAWMGGVGGSSTKVRFFTKSAPATKHVWEWVQVRNFNFASSTHLGETVVTPRKKYAWIGAAGQTNIAFDRLVVQPKSSPAPTGDGGSSD